MIVGMTCGVLGSTLTRSQGRRRPAYILHGEEVGLVSFVDKVSTISGSSQS